MTAESQWPGAVAGSAGVGAATGKRVILLCFLLCTYPGTVHHSIGRTDWTLPAGGQRFGSSASRSARTVRQSIDRQDKTENGRPLLFICFCCVRGYLDYRHISNCDTGTTVIQSVPYLPSACGGGRRDLSKVRSGLALPCHALSCLHLYISTSIRWYISPKQPEVDLAR